MSRRLLPFLLFAGLLFGRATLPPQTPPKPATGPSVYDFNLPDINGKMTSLAGYKNKVLLIVNVASRSIFVDQCKALESLYQEYKASGLVVVAFPSNDFGNEEPDGEAKFRPIYDGTYHLTFPIYSKVAVRGEDITPLFHYLTKEANPKISGDVHWNFTKFVVDRQGQLAARFEPDIAPDDPQLLIAIENALKAKNGEATSPQTPPSPAPSGRQEPRSRDPE